MTLKQWRDNSLLEDHKTSREEIRGWLLKADRNLADGRIGALSSDAKFLHAYNSVLLIATAALAVCSFRPDRRDSHHVRAFQSLEFTVRWPKERVEVLDRLQRKRNHSVYDPSGSVSEGEAQRMVAFATELRQDMEKWLKEEHPELV